MTNMNENDGQMRNESEYSLAKIAEWGVIRAAELKREGRLGTPTTDPFALWNSSARQRDARWAYELWSGILGNPARIHVRRIHYALLGHDVIPPWRTKMGRKRSDGTRGRQNEAYCEVNPESDFKQLIDAFRDARHVGLIEAELIEDHRNPDIQWAGESTPTSLSSYSSDADNTGIFSVDELVTCRSTFIPCPIPTWRPLIDRSLVFDNANMFAVNRPRDLYHAMLPYRLAIVSEKSGVNDAVEAALQSLPIKVDYLEMIGYSSLTRILEYLRGIRDRYPGKDLLLFYLADFDMAGRNMPRTFAQNVRYDFERRAFLYGSEIPSVKVYHLALTEDQVREYDLPHAPESRDPTRAKYELDALVQLHPEALKSIIIEALKRYDDAELRESCDKALYERHDEWLEEGRALLEDAEDEARSHYETFAPTLEEAWSNVNIALGNYDKLGEEHRDSIEEYNTCLTFRLDDETLKGLRKSLNIESGAHKIRPPDCPLIDEIAGIREGGRQNGQA
jgi:hypothetical protein